MGIRFRKYSTKNSEVRAVKLTETNVVELVEYINKHRGTALDESTRIPAGNLFDKEYVAPKISLVQKNVGWNGKVKRGVRKAFIGAGIVRKTITNAETNKISYEFYRIPAAEFENYRAS